MILGPANEKGTRLRLQCDGCGSEFSRPRSHVRRETQYCSIQCAGNAMRTPERGCERCGASYRPHKKGQRFCGGTCARESKRNGAYRPCKECGEPYYAPLSEVISGKRRFCSRSCQLQAAQESRWQRHAFRTNAFGKECRRCGVTKPIEQFRTLGPRSWYHLCSPCERIDERERREKDPVGRYSSARRYRTSRKGRLNTRRKASVRRARLREADGAYTTKDLVRIWHRQRGECARCHVRIGNRPSDTEYHIDHVTPIARGGSNYEKNIQLLCAPCNWQKGNKTPAEYTLYLKRLEAAERS